MKLRFIKAISRFHLIDQAISALQCSAINKIKSTDCLFVWFPFLVAIVGGHGNIVDCKWNLCELFGWTGLRSWGTGCLITWKETRDHEILDR